jgi:hypothetical protein
MRRVNLYGTHGGVVATVMIPTMHVGVVMFDDRVFVMLDGKYMEESCFCVTPLPTSSCKQESESSDPS